LTTAYPVP